MDSIFAKLANRRKLQPIGEFHCDVATLPNSSAVRSMDVVTFYCTKQVYAYQKNCVSAKTVESLCEQPEDALE
eukprot:scaffold165675_cov59-Cyclotella_meneghiniana.AAC.1